MTLLILLVIYVASVIGCYYAVRYEYNNKYEIITPSLFQVILIFIPVLNSVYSIFMFLDFLSTTDKGKGYIVKFFKINR